MSHGEPIKFVDLLPELQDWNNGDGASIDVWLSNNGNFKLAIAFAQLFWPEFVEYDGCVFFADRSMDSYPNFLRQTKGDRTAVEAVINHLHILDLFPAGVNEVSEPQIRHIGRMLTEMWMAKLSRDYPEKIFEVHFNDQPNLDLLDYQVTFWQPRNGSGG